MYVDNYQNDGYHKEIIIFRGGSRNLSWGGPGWVRGDHQSHGRGGGGGGGYGFTDLDIDIVGVLF